MDASLNQSQLHGQTIVVGSYKFSPIVRKIEMSGGRIPLRLRWMSPTAIRLRHPDGRIEKINIPDPTRRIQMGLLLGVVGIGVLMLLRRQLGGKRSGAHQ
jgi:hypothetical protein